jgi:hypothetical protein
LTRFDSLFRVIDEIFFLVYFLGKGACGKEIGEDHVSAERKERFTELVLIAGFS